MKESFQTDDGDREITGEPDEASGTISYLCMKYNRHQDGDKMACQDPDLYCKYRTACLIHFMAKENRPTRGPNESSSR